MDDTNDGTNPEQINKEKSFFHKIKDKVEDFNQVSNLNPQYATLINKPIESISGDGAVTPGDTTDYSKINLTFKREFIKSAPGDKVGKTKLKFSLGYKLIAKEVGDG
jgi:hypothetical protein